MAVDIVIPTVAESVTSGVIAKWNKRDGESVKRDETVLELETDKVTMEVAATAAGVVKHLVPVGTTVQIGQVVGSIDAAGVASAAPVAAPVAAAAKEVAQPVAAGAASHAGGSAAETRATPLARKLAEEHGVDISRIEGTGPGNRVREQDVNAFVQGAKGSPAAKPNGAAPSSVSAAAPKPASPSVPGSRTVTRDRVSPLRARIAQRLVQAQHTAAMLTTFNECDMSAVMDLRKQYKEEFEKKQGVGLGFMGFFVKAATAALKAFPLVNGSFITDEKGEPTIEKHDYCDIAMAVSTPKGLVVPVVRNCETLSFSQIELAIKDLATRGRDGKLTLDEMQGGTFTITNGGVFGSLMSTPILNPPQSAILGLHAIKNRAVEYPVGSGQVAIRPMMYLALSYDHRIIDGAEAVQFLVKIKQAIEDPSRLLLGM
jgi:2-oxoglutarate dehydrogenase E2 component (dihydrolipoamide succinyltransferase)